MERRTEAGGDRWGVSDHILALLKERQPKIWERARKEILSERNTETGRWGGWNGEKMNDKEEGGEKTPTADRTSIWKVRNVGKRRRRERRHRREEEE